MIIQQSVSAPVITSIGAVASKFKIKASAKAFKILSGFYSEPILAIPRELGANAWDAHVKAKNTDKMFEVHAPNNLEPWFSIRDFGTGLSSEDIDKIYTTYFESTKTSDNDSDGCMGLGSKTPFNYTENFSVMSYFNGTKYVYNCFIDAAGSPNILHVVTEPTSEPNGLKITFAVKISDISMFIEKITRAYEPFRFRPNITGASIVFKEREYDFHGTDWSVRKNVQSSSCRAFMGNYSYPINYDSVHGRINKIASEKDRNKIRTILNSGQFDFFYNIGKLEVAPNKEQLQYDADNKTADAIIATALNVSTELASLVNKELSVPSSLWQAMSFHLKYNSYRGNFSQIRQIIGDIPIKFKNGAIDTLINYSQLSIHDVNVALKLVDKPINYNTPKLPQKYSLGVLNYRSHSDTFVVRSRGDYYVTENGEFPIFLYTAEDSLKKSKIRHFLKTKFPTDKIPDAIIVTDQSTGFSVFKQHCKYLGIPDSTVYHIESLPKPPVAKREAKIATTDEIHFAEIPTDISKRYIYWSKREKTFTDTDTNYYVDFYYANQNWNSINIKKETVSSVILFLATKNILPATVKTIWGINIKNKRLLKIGKWINILDLAKEQIEKNHKAFYEQNSAMLGFVGAIGRLSHCRHVISSSHILSKIKNADTQNRFKAILKLSSDISKIPEETAIICSLFGIEPKLHTPPEINPIEFEILMDKKYYGLFTMFDRYAISEKVEKFSELINFIDEKS